MKGQCPARLHHTGLEAALRQAFPAVERWCNMFQIVDHHVALPCACVHPLTCKIVAATHGNKHEICGKFVQITYKFARNLQTAPDNIWRALCLQTCRYMVSTDCTGYLKIRRCV